MAIKKPRLGSNYRYDKVNTEWQKKFDKIYDKWTVSKKIEDRIGIIAEFMSYSMERIVQVTPASATPTLLSVLAESRRFCNKAILKQEDPHIEYALSKNWYESLLAQTLDDEDIDAKNLFDYVGLNYEDAIRPSFDDGSTIEEFAINDVVSGAIKPVKLRVCSIGLVRVGSRVRSPRSRKGIWHKVVSVENGVAELENDVCRTPIWRDVAQIDAHWEIDNGDLLE